MNSAAARLSERCEHSKIIDERFQRVTTKCQCLACIEELISELVALAAEDMRERAAKEARIRINEWLVSGPSAALGAAVLIENAIRALPLSPPDDRPVPGKGNNE